MVLEKLPSSSISLWRRA